MVRKIPESAAQILLGKKIEQYRKERGMTRMQLGKIINETEQKVGKFEAGGFVPIEMLELIGETLGNRIQKKIIRKISKYRAFEIEERIDAPELLELYEEAFPDLDEFKS
jgi:transcriptional regulator with XRE-family HTH domain